MNTAHCKNHDVACKSVIKAFVKQVVAVVPNLTMLGTIRRIAALQVHHLLAACLAEGAQQLEPPDKRVRCLLPPYPPSQYLGCMEVLIGRSQVMQPCASGCRPCPYLAMWCTQIHFRVVGQRAPYCVSAVKQLLRMEPHIIILESARRRKRRWF